jgi:hypothetical protein
MGPFDLGHHAQLYAAQGVEILACKETAGKGAKMPYLLHGKDDATNDVDAVGAMWKRHPKALIARRPPLGEVVADFDPRDGGLEVFDALVAEYGPFPATRRVNSGGPDGSFHLIFQWPYDGEKPSTKRLKAWAKDRGLGRINDQGRFIIGVDLITHDQRYQILPPSPHPKTGDPYTWVAGEVADIPDWFGELLRPEAPASPKPTPPPSSNGSKPGDSVIGWFNDHHTWAGLLGPRGWTVEAGDGETPGSKWRHPDASNDTSASINDRGDLYVFSDRTPFEPTGDGDPHGYDRFAAFALLEHSGDTTAAVKAAYRLRGDPDPATGGEDVHGGGGGEGHVRVVVHDLDAFLDSGQPEYDWLIPGLIERRDRLIVTGGEGSGKSTLLRQIGFKSAAGLHPFRDDTVDPIRVLLVDLENSERQLRRELSKLRDIDRVVAGRFQVASKPDGLDLHQTAPDQTWLATAIDQAAPDLVVIGPIYKMSDGDPNDEGPAKAVIRFLDQLRATYGFAVALEAHSPHAQHRQGKTKRPYGASIWKRWPEFGLWLGPRKGGTAVLDHWRGARDERAWPRSLADSGPWPFHIASGRDATFAEMVAAVEAGAPTTTRKLAEHLGVDHNQIHRAIQANKAAWEAVLDGVA